MLPSVVCNFDNSTGPSTTASLLFPPPPIIISNRKSGIRNPNNRRISNHFHFSNRKYSAIFHNESASHSPFITRHCPSNRDTAIKIPDKPPHFNDFQFSNRDKMRVLRPEHISGNASFGPSLPPNCSSLVTHPLSLDLPPCPRASVANLCDNGWLKLRLM
jgi:hypothetical protein